MANSDLTNYITQLRSTHVTDADIKAQLLKVGWSEADISQALTPAPAPPGNIPPPPIPRFGMWVSFQYVLLFVTLWIWSIALGGVLHYGIDKHIPEAAALGQVDYGGMMNSYFLQGYLASLIVAYPFFVWFFILVKKQIEATPTVRNIKIRKFLIYFTMVINFIYMVSELIKTVFSFLGANTSSRAVPHLLVSLLIPGLICWYLLNEVREDRKVVS